MDFDQSTLTLIAIASVIVGLASCFYGYRIFRVHLAIVGFMFGFSVASVFVAESDSLVQIIVGVIGGLIGAGIAYYLYFVGVFVAGLGLGATFALTILSSASVDSTIVIIGVVVGAVIGAVLALLINKLMIALATAFIGAAQIIYGGAILLLPEVVVETQTGRVELDFQQGTSVVVLILWIVLGIIGFLYQLRNNREIGLFKRSD